MHSHCSLAGPAEFHLLGTVHGHDVSKRHIRYMLDAVKPDIVIIELEDDVARRLPRSSLYPTAAHSDTNQPPPRDWVRIKRYAYVSTAVVIWSV